MTPPLRDKVALITGAAKRVGRAIALELARGGMHIAFTYRTSADEARSLVDEVQSLGRTALAIEVDLAEPHADEIVHEQFTATYARLDALVNNASVFESSPPGRVTLESFDHHMAVNARAPLMLAQRFAPMLAAHYDPDHASTMGRIINFIDIHVMGQPLKGYAAYNVSKAALMEATMTLAMELAPKITVNAIAPGVVAWADSYTPAQRELYMKRVPLARPGTPADAAATTLYLIRDAHYCTGQIIRLDGGRLLT